MSHEEQDFRGELEALFDANAPLINLVTYEEDRVIQTVLDVTRTLGVYTWDVLGYLEEKRPSGKPVDASKAVEPEKILQFIARALPDQTVLVLKDFHMAWKNGPLIRGLRNLAPKLRSQSKFLVMVTPMEDVPVELKDELYVLHVPLPDETVLMRVLDAMTSKLEPQHQPRPAIRRLLINSALGLTTNQARMAFSRVWAKQRRFDEQAVQLVTKEKRRIVRESGALEFTPAGANEADVGGLNLMKSWLKLRECVFTEEARQAGLPYPKGVALIGIPGTGKSLSARMTASVLKLPLLRMDMGAIFGSLLGESEAHIRKAVNLAEMVSPCILWIDEMEKAFAGAGPTGGGGSGGFAQCEHGRCLVLDGSLQHDRRKVGHLQRRGAGLRGKCGAVIGRRCQSRLACRHGSPDERRPHAGRLGHFGGGQRIGQSDQSCGIALPGRRSGWRAVPSDVRPHG